MATTKQIFKHFKLTIMKNKKQKIEQLQSSVKQQLISKLVLNNVKGGIGCPPPIRGQKKGQD